MHPHTVRKAEIMSQYFPRFQNEEPLSLDLWFYQIILARDIKEDEIKLCKYANTFSHIDPHCGSSTNKYLRCKEKD